MATTHFEGTVLKIIVCHKSNGVFSSSVTALLHEDMLFGF